MMKTIRNPKDTNRYQVTCKDTTNCDALIECSRGDLVFHASEDGDFYTMKCLHCGQGTTVLATGLIDLIVAPS